MLQEEQQEQKHKPFPVGLTIVNETTGRLSLSPLFGSHFVGPSKEEIPFRWTLTKGSVAFIPILLRQYQVRSKSRDGYLYSVSLCSRIIGLSSRAVPQVDKLGAISCVSTGDGYPKLDGGGPGVNM